MDRVLVRNFEKNFCEVLIIIVSFCFVRVNWKFFFFLEVLMFCYEFWFSILIGIVCVKCYFGDFLSMEILRGIKYFIIFI